MPLMAAPTISLATMGSSRKKSSKAANSEDTVVQKPVLTNSDKKCRKFWGEEHLEDAIYSVYLKKINYFIKCEDMGSSKVDDRSDQSCDQTDTSADNRKSPKRTTIWYDEQQCLQWETRQTRIIKAATLDHLVKYILFLSPNQRSDDHWNQNVLEEERNNVAHAMHVLFCTYRQFHLAQELFDSIIKHQHNCCTQQLHFILHYWLDNYAEDFQSDYICETNDKNSVIDSKRDSTSSTNSFFDSHSSSMSSEGHKPMTVADKLLSLPNIDDKIYRKCLNIVDLKPESSPDVIATNQKSVNKSSSVLELDPRFIAQQLTAIDLENFLHLKPYLLLNTSRSKSKIQNMIRNFNLLSRHVIITILKAHRPDIVTSHWIEVALQLRKIRNFNSLKAIIAGLTNESIYRLKQSVWTKISRASMSTFKWLSTIVDDVNNQTLLRHTQLIIEGTSKVSLEDESFGTIPYLGTFLTDITMINTRYPSYVNSKLETKLINFEKCCQQYEILTQILLLQKNVIAALTAIQQQTQQLGRHYLTPINKPFTPTIPRVARIFRIWFQANDIELITDKNCYELSLTIESSPTKAK